MATTSSKGENWVDIDDFLSFVFPKHIQHPLTSGRLFCYALFGPLDADNNLRSGFKRSHVLHDYELENMCIQFDREDVISIFVSDFEELSNCEQSMIVGQANSKFKIARGKAMLQTLSRAEILHLIKHIPRDSRGNIRFHDIQETVMSFRKQRIADLKLVYPSISNANSSTSRGPTKLSDIVKSQRIESNRTSIPSKSDILSRQKYSASHRNTDGLSNAEVTEGTTRSLSRHSFKVCSIGDKSTSNIIPNVLLLRDSASSGRFTT